MAQVLQVSEAVARRTVETEVTRNVGIPSRLPPAERVVSTNARIEITEATAQSGTVVFSGIIRSSIYYASADDPSNIVSIRRNFNFTERVSVPGSRPGYEVNVDSGITDIDFYVINERLLGVEYLVTSEIEVTAPERIEFIEDKEGIELRRQEFRIRREVQERNYTRRISSVERINSAAPDIRRIINADSEVKIIDVISDFDQIIVKGVVSNDILYLSPSGQIEYASLDVPFSEGFSFRGVTPDMTPFVEATVTKEDITRVDDRRVRKDVTINFKVLVVKEVEITIPTGIISPEEVFPVRRTVIIERVVAEEKTRFLARGRIEIPEGNPDISRIIRATGRIRAGSMSAEASTGGVLISGTVDVNIIYVADLPEQPVYFASGTINFSYFIDIPQVTSDMSVIADVDITKTTASIIDERNIQIRSTIEVNLLVTEKVRVPIVTGVQERPTTEGFITYTVRSGDTLYLIARRYGVSVNRLIEINNISDPANIQVGQQILIPG